MSSLMIDTPVEPCGLEAIRESDEENKSSLNKKSTNDEVNAPTIQVTENGSSRLSVDSPDRPSKLLHAKSDICDPEREKNYTVARELEVIATTPASAVLIPKGETSERSVLIPPTRESMQIDPLNMQIGTAEVSAVQSGDGPEKEPGEKTPPTRELQITCPSTTVSISKPVTANKPENPDLSQDSFLREIEEIHQKALSSTLQESPCIPPQKQDKATSTSVDMASQTEPNQIPDPPVKSTEFSSHVDYVDRALTAHERRLREIDVWRERKDRKIGSLDADLHNQISELRISKDNLLATHENQIAELRISNENLQSKYENLIAEHGELKKVVTDILMVTPNFERLIGDRRSDADVPRSPNPNVTNGRQDHVSTNGSSGSGYADHLYYQPQTSMYPVPRVNNFENNMPTSNGTQIIPPMYEKEKVYVPNQRAQGEQAVTTNVGSSAQMYRPVYEQNKMIYPNTYSLQSNAYPPLISTYGPQLAYEGTPAYMYSSFTPQPAYPTVFTMPPESEVIVLQEHDDTRPPTNGSVSVDPAPARTQENANTSSAVVSVKDSGPTNANAKNTITEVNTEVPPRENASGATTGSEQSKPNGKSNYPASRKVNDNQKGNPQPQRAYDKKKNETPKESFFKAAKKVIPATKPNRGPVAAPLPQRQPMANRKIASKTNTTLPQAKTFTLSNMFSALDNGENESDVPSHQPTPKSRAGNSTTLNIDPNNEYPPLPTRAAPSSDQVQRGQTSVQNDEKGASLEVTWADDEAEDSKTIEAFLASIDNGMQPPTRAITSTHFSASTPIASTSQANQPTRINHRYDGGPTDQHRTGAPPREQMYSQNIPRNNVNNPPTQGTGARPKTNYGANTYGGNQQNSSPPKVVTRNGWYTEPRKRKRTTSDGNYPAICGGQVRTHRDVFVRGLKADIYQSPDVMADAIQDFCEGKGVDLFFIRIMNNQSGDGYANAKITVQVQDYERVTGRDFWPETVSAREWYVGNKKGNNNGAEKQQ